MRLATETPFGHRFLARLAAETEKEARLQLVPVFGRYRAVNARIVPEPDGGYIAFLHLVYDEGNSTCQ